MPDRGRRTAGIIAGAVALLGGGIGLALAHRRATSTTPPPTGQPGADLRWTSTTFGTITATLGRRATLVLTIANAGTQPGIPQLASTVVTLGGTIVSDITFSFLGTPPTIMPGATAQVTLVSSPIPAQYTGDMLEVTLQLAGGTDVSKTITGSIQVQALPADLEFVESSFGTITVQVGQYATFTAQIVNNGGSPGVPQIVSGVTTLNGVVEGHWQIINPPTIQPGQTATVTFQSDGPIASQFAGDTLGVAIQIA